MCIKIEISIPLPMRKMMVLFFHSMNCADLQAGAFLYWRCVWYYDKKQSVGLTTKRRDIVTADFSSLQNSMLFANISQEDLQKMLVCISAREKVLERDSFVFHAGDAVQFVYLIVSGSMHIIDEDFWGNRSIVETMEKDTLFGEAYVFSAREQQLVSVIAAEDSVVLEIDPVRLFEICSLGCSCHAQLVKNALRLLAEKIVRLTEKLGHMIKRTLREKILSYLSACAQREKSNAFRIPYSRQQLADYLCVDRSALSHELSRLQKEGRIRYHKNNFELLDEA